MLYLILALGLILRLYGMNWDSGFHLHPDERMLMIVATRIKFFSNLDPDFFNYGSLPIYILKATGDLIDFLFGTKLSNYDGLLYIGRSLSIVADLLTILLIYKIAALLFSKILKKQAKTAGLLASFLYATTFFPIQNSHFFIVDNFLNLFSTLLFYLLLKLLDKKRISWKDTIPPAIVSAAILATKISGILFVSTAALTIIYKSLKTIKKIKKQPLATYYLLLATPILTFNFALLTFNFIFMPYAFLRWRRFLSDILLQMKMNSDPYIFPYTLQYVDTVPYLYYLKNIFFWGAGPVISLLALFGLILMLKNIKNLKKHPEIILFLFYYGLYFLILGKSAVKFMRYMLPLYPALSLLAAYTLTSLKSLGHLKIGIWNLPRTRAKHGTGHPVPYLFWYRVVLGILLLHIFYLLPFLSIYSKPNTRIQATEWILKNVPAGSTLAIEHWDDRLPLYGGENYQFVELQLYNQPDNAYKWKTFQNQLMQADYIIIASNRLYKPLQKLADCEKYKVCYPKTAEYYKRLFNNLPIWTEYGALKFQKIAEFSNYPRILNFEIKDDSADESFTVYDHPKVMIFKKNKSF